ncbi:MAG: hypothetical protein EBQ77_09260 [Sphingobacteriia bacterium]|jgi:uncharacterized membrane protein SirB2|nr:hypothetical protein [Sphingobacteriia bacterium]
MATGFFHTHYLTVILFLLLYVIKTILLLSGRDHLLERFSKSTRVPEMIISSLFLITGIYLLTQTPLGGPRDYLLWIKLTLIGLSIPIAVIGFKRKNKILAALSLLCITASFGLAEVYKNHKLVVNNTGITDIRTLYKNNCALCHGENGDAGINGSKNLKITTLKESEIIDIIHNGKNTMPKASLDDLQIKAMARFVLDSLRSK